jgi:hypothetical protein
MSMRKAGALLMSEHFPCTYNVMALSVHNGQVGLMTCI